MGGVLSYSGLSTKIRAMQSRLTTMDQFEEILQLSDVTQVAAYLKRMPEYSSRWDALDENTLHRGQIEKLLKKSIFQNFSRIYHFANPEQRKFLDLYSKRYEIRVLKEVMTNIFDHRDTDPVDVSPYREFFRLHSNIDVDRITTCSTMEELISCLKGNEFYIPLSKIQEHETALLFDRSIFYYHFSICVNKGNDVTLYISYIKIGDSPDSHKDQIGLGVITVPDDSSVSFLRKEKISCPLIFSHCIVYCFFSLWHQYCRKDI